MRSQSIGRCLGIQHGSHPKSSISCYQNGAGASCWESFSNLKFQNWMRNNHIGGTLNVGLTYGWAHDQPYWSAERNYTGGLGGSEEGAGNLDRSEWWTQAGWVLKFIDERKTNTPLGWLQSAPSGRKGVQAKPGVKQSRCPHSNLHS